MSLQEHPQTYVSLRFSRCLRSSVECELSHKAAVFSTPFSQLPWLESYRFANPRPPFGCVASLKTTTVPFRLFTDLSTEIKRFFSLSSAVHLCPDYADLKHTLPHELTDMAENYAKY